MASLLLRKAVLRLGVLAVAIALLLNLTRLPLMAQGDVSFRISRLETENRNLRSRIDRLESQIDRLSRVAGITVPAPAEAPAGAADPSLEPDLMFDNLATLVIETRQDMFALQERVDALEALIRENSAPATEPEAPRL
ncbi:MAG: hypothetical protein VKK04_11410 [Synechococcales bacterium]|nr:hypothetical protein [Synechococcales bacterium]